MQSDINQIMIGSVVRKAITDARNSPGRSVRNLVDAGVNFAKGTYQKRFLEEVQEILRNQNSSYYALADDILSNVDRHILFTLGMNLGYNGCTKGTRIIRETEQKRGFHVPWTFAVRLKSPDGESTEEMTGWENPEFQEQAYQRIFREGTALGVFTYLLFSEGMMSEKILRILLSVFTSQKECAFVLCTGGGRIPVGFIRAAGACGNVLIAVPEDEYMTENCRNLRKARMLYGIYFRYEEKDRQKILGGMWLSEISAARPQFAFLLSGNTAFSETVREVYQYVRNVRASQEHPLICMDIRQDAAVIDRAVSCDGNMFSEPLILEPYGDDGKIKYIRNAFRPDEQKYRSLEEVFRKTDVNGALTT